MSDPIPEDPIGYTEAGKLLGVHRDTIRNWAVAGKLRRWHLGGTIYRVSREEVLRQARPMQGSTDAPPAIQTHGHRAAVARLRAKGILP